MGKKSKILLVDDEKSIRNALRDILEFEGYTCIDVENGNQALENLKEGDFDAMLLDIKMKGMDGMEVMAKVSELYPNIPVIMLSGHGTIETAMQAIKLGAYDFLEKPPDLNRLLVSVRNALDKQHLVKTTTKLRKKIQGDIEILGESEPIAYIKKTIAKVAPTDARVLITGENGTGKELVAKSVHAQSKRHTAEFIAVNCAAIPTELLESELFGHEKGAFTGADKQRIGKFELADGGTLFLDEIGDMSMEAQAKVLRALQENAITRVGGNSTISVNVRILAATNKDLQEEIEIGNFREDLYHRLSVIPIHVPALRERKADIPLLAAQFLDQLAQADISVSSKEFTNEALEALKDFDWTGNVRELQNVVERLAILSDGNRIEVDDVQFLVKRNGKNGGIDQWCADFETFHEFKDQTEAYYFKTKLDEFNWNISQTADNIGIQRSHLYQKIKKYRLEK